MSNIIIDLIDAAIYLSPVMLAALLLPMMIARLVR